MRSRALVDALTTIVLVVWLNVVGAALMPQFAEALILNEWCDPALKSCPLTVSTCTGICTSFGQVGNCTSYALLPCVNSGAACQDLLLCTCNPIAC